MSEKEKEIIQKFGEVVPSMDEKKKEYLLGVVDGIALMSESDHKKEKGEERHNE